MVAAACAAPRWILARDPVCIVEAEVVLADLVVEIAHHGQALLTGVLIFDLRQQCEERAELRERLVVLRRHYLHVGYSRDRAEAQRIPVLQVFHVEEDEGAGNPFSRRSGLVEALPGLNIRPTDVFSKSVHSAMFASNAEGQSLDYWLRKHGVERIIVSGIRTEQCCETTTRHASDMGYKVSYVMDATLTFQMVTESGRIYTPQDIMERTELVLGQARANNSRLFTSSPGRSTRALRISIAPLPIRTGA